MDGVLTDSARVHAAAWKRSFDDLLRRLQGPDARPFELPGDYERYVDGKLREDGVRDFLASRGITLPEGSPGDAPGALTVDGVAAAKNDMVLATLAEQGVDVYPGSLRFLRACADAGVPCALVSSSANARQVVEAADIAPFLAALVDGVTARELGLRGKPDPDAFLEAARRLGVPPARRRSPRTRSRASPPAARAASAWSWASTGAATRPTPTPWPPPGPTSW
jgi:beta-phosphoglucomutase-like phosphatase (HAD superfamily)